MKDQYNKYFLETSKNIVPGKEDIFAVVQVMPGLIEGVAVLRAPKQVLGHLLELSGGRPYQAILGAVTVMNVEIQDGDFFNALTFVLIDSVGSPDSHIVEDAEPPRVVVFLVVVVDFAQGAGMVARGTHSAKSILDLRLIREMLS